MSYILIKQYLVSSLWLRYGLTFRYQNLFSVKLELQKMSIFLLHHIVFILSCCKFTLSQIRCWVALITEEIQWPPLVSTSNLSCIFFSSNIRILVYFYACLSVFLIFPGQPRKSTFQLHPSDHKVKEEALSFLNFKSTIK